MEKGIIGLLIVGCILLGFYLNKLNNQYNQVVHDKEMLIAKLNEQSIAIAKYASAEQSNKKKAEEQLQQLSKDYNSTITLLNRDIANLTQQNIDLNKTINERCKSALNFLNRYRY